MHNLFNPIVEANKVGMLRSRHKSAFLFVEGESDCRFFATFVDLTACTIIPAFGKDNVIDTVMELERRQISGVLGIVDADFWIVEGTSLSVQNIIVTETHDTESLMLSSGALEKLVREYIPGNRMDMVSTITEELRNELLKLGLPLGYIRWVSWRESYNLQFRDIDFSSFIDSGGELDLVKLMQEIRRRTTTRNLPSDQLIIQKALALKQARHDAWSICQGHDLAELIKFALPNILQRKCDRDVARRATQNLRKTEPEAALRQAYGIEHFRGTRLWNAICDWEKANAPYCILGVNFRCTINPNKVSL